MLRCTLSLMAQSRHPDRVGECPLSEVKRTSKFKSVTSAFDPKRACRTSLNHLVGARPHPHPPPSRCAISTMVLR